MSDPSIDALARRLARLEALVRVPRQMPMLGRQGVVHSVNPLNNTVSVSVGQSDTIVAGVSFAQAYTPDHLPSPGDTCWLHVVNGKNLLVVGKHVTGPGVIQL